MIASPRKMCVPGVQACAMAGVSTSASNTARAMAPAETARGEARVTVARLNPDPLALPANRFSQIVQLVLHDVVDRVASGVDIVPHLFYDLVDRDPIDHLLSAIDCRPEPASRPRRSPPRSFSGATPGPAGAFESATSGPLCAVETRQSRQSRPSSRVPAQRSHRSASRSSPPQPQRDSAADRRADQRRCQQVVLLLTLIVQIHFWV